MDVDTRRYYIIIRIIYCDGDYGCYYSQSRIEAAENVYCDGQYACYKTQGDIQGKNVHC